MSSLVVNELGTLGESFCTFITFIWFLPIMESLVLNEMGVMAMESFHNHCIHKVFPVWILRWTMSWEVCLKVLPHSEHSYGFSSVDSLMPNEVWTPIKLYHIHHSDTISVPSELPDVLRDQRTDLDVPQVPYSHHIDPLWISFYPPVLFLNHFPVWFLLHLRVELLDSLKPLYWQSNFLSWESSTEHP